MLLQKDQTARAYRGALCAQLDADFDHVDWLNDAGGEHATESTIEKGLDALPDRVGAWEWNVCHHELHHYLITCVNARQTSLELIWYRCMPILVLWPGHVCLNVTLTRS